MDDAVLTRLYGYHGNRTEDVYNATRFPERRYATTGVDGYNRMLAGSLERVDNDFPRPYGPSADDWVDERDKVREEQRAEGNYRNNRYFTEATASTVTGECRRTSAVRQQQAGRRDGTSDSLSADHKPASPSANEHIGSISLVVNRSENSVVMLCRPVVASLSLSDITSDAVAAERSRGINGVDEKGGTSRAEQRGQRNAAGLAARIKTSVHQYVNAKLRRHRR